MLIPVKFDLETTANGGPTGDSPEAHWRVNRVLMCGYKNLRVVQTDNNCDNLIQWIKDIIKRGDTPLLTAHNAKFDIKYLMRDYPHVKWHECRVWDTMTFEYLDSGHLDKMMSLEQACAKRGISFVKSLDLDGILKSGLRMEDIPKDDLKEYLIADVDSLAALQGVQAKEAHQGYFMDHILPLAEIELNGLNVDEAELAHLFESLTRTELAALEWAQDKIMEMCEWQDGSPVVRSDFNDMDRPKIKCIKPYANRTMSFLLFGTPATLQMGGSKWHLKYKRGMRLPWTLKEFTAVSEYYADTTPSNLGYPVDEDTLAAVCEAAGTTPTYIKQALEYRKAHKVTGTYLGPMTQQLRHGGVYPKYNTAVTATGRLSSSDPNGQNMPEEVRTLVTKLDDKYKVCEVDFSQLEMYTTAIESEDKALSHDLQHGVDVHYLTAKEVFGEALAEAKRKIAKNVNFGVLYGGKAYGLSKQTGVDKDTIQKLIDAFFGRYPRIKEWQEEFFTSVTDNMEPHDVKEGEQRYRATVKSKTTGRRFTFVENAAPDWFRRRHHTKWCFSPNQTANYPIQGVAGGDIVMQALYWVWWDLKRLELKSFLFCTVHDSFVLQLHTEEYSEVIPIIGSALERIKDEYSLPLDLKVDIEVNDTWQ